MFLDNWFWRDFGDFDSFLGCDLLGRGGFFRWRLLGDCFFYGRGTVGYFFRRSFFCNFDLGWLLIAN